MLHTGIDLHKRDLVVTTVDAAGQPVKTARLRTTRPAVTAYFGSLGVETGDQRAVVESTATWYWLADLLRAQGIALTLGHSKYIKAISYAGRAPCAVAQPATGEDRRRRRGHPRPAPPE
jgi:transposase